MVVVSYKSKRELKLAIGEVLKWSDTDQVVESGKPFFVTNMDGTFKATVVMANGVIESVR